MDVENGLNWLRIVGLGGRIKVNEFYSMTTRPNTPIFFYETPPYMRSVE